MKKFLLLCTVFLSAILLVTSCNKDEYTEKDAEKARMVQLTVIVKDINNQSTVMDGFEISSPQSGEVYKTTTTDYGWVNVFVKSGKAALRIKKEGYVSTLAVVDASASSGQSVVTVVPMFANAQGDSYGTITGTVKAHTDFTQDYTSLVPVANANVSLTIDVAALADLSDVDTELNFYRPAAISYDDSTLMQPAITDAAGAYSIKIPVTTKEVTYTVNVAETPVTMTAYHANAYSDAVALNNSLKGYVSTNTSLNKYANTNVAQFVTAGPSTASFSGVNIVLPAPTSGGTPAPGKTASFTLSSADFISTQYTLAKAEITTTSASCYSFTQNPIVSYGAATLIPYLTMNTRPTVEVVMDANKFVTGVRVTDAGSFTLSRDNKQMPDQKNNFVINTFERMASLIPATYEIATGTGTVDVTGANSTLNIAVVNAGKGYAAVPNVLVKLRKVNSDGTYTYKTYTASDFGTSLGANNGIVFGTTSVNIEGFVPKNDIASGDYQIYYGSTWTNLNTYTGGTTFNLYIKTYDDNTAYNNYTFAFKAEMKSTSTMSNINTSIIDGGLGYANGAVIVYKLDHTADGVALPAGSERVIAHAKANVDANGTITSISDFEILDNDGWDTSSYPAVSVETHANSAKQAYIRAVVDPKSGAISGLSSYDESTGVWSAPTVSASAGYGYVTAPGNIVPEGVSRRPAKITTTVSGGQLKLTVTDGGEEYNTNIVSGPAIFTNYGLSNNKIVTNGSSNHTINVDLMPHVK